MVPLLMLSHGLEAQGSPQVRCCHVGFSPGGVAFTPAVTLLHLGLVGFGLVACPVKVTVRLVCHLIS